MAKALVLVSGGLDSMLTCRLLMEQGVEVIGLSFKSCFFGTAKAKKAAEQLGIRLIERDFSPNHLDIVKKPKYGYGKNMNPCIDCHSLMFRIAKEIMEEEGIDFVASGEILNQRPKSQNLDALGIVAKYSGLDDLLVRPMSAKHLPETKPEKDGILDRSKLMNIKGRRRDKQLELVKKFKIEKYASPGGGCILTDPAYSDRLREMISIWPECDGNDVDLIKNGRVTWLKTQTDSGEKDVLVVIGRDKKDCDNLENLAKTGDIMIRLREMVGPTTVLRIKDYESKVTDEIREVEIPEQMNFGLEGSNGKKIEELINDLTLSTGYYSTKARGKKVEIEIIKK